MSLGPELKIFNESTGIVLPDKIFYDNIPEWDEIRAPARFIVMANLALAVLASYAVYGLIKNKFSSFKQQLVLTAVIGFVILFEFSMIPYPSYSEPIPDIYEEIKNDESKFVVLSSPLGGHGDLFLLSDPRILYHQIYHEKPIYGGYESRVSFETPKETLTYFLNIFDILGNQNDVIKQDLATHGLSLFDYFDIKYVTIHKKLHREYEKTYGLESIVETKQIMSEILSGDDPVYEDDSIAVYKIPKPNSLEPFLLLGSGWHTFDNERGERLTMKNSEILIVNPTNSEMSVTLNVVLGSIEKEKIITVSLNDEKVGKINIPTLISNVKIEDLILKSGVNVVTLDADDFVVVEYDLEGTEVGKRQKTTVSLNIKSISITD